MKRYIFVVVIAGLALPLFAQLDVPPHNFVSGNWGFIGPRLYQNDAGARLARANFTVPQSGVMVYEFNIRYEGGAEDGHGGVGLHIFIDNALNVSSWGVGRSYLLWLNYDETSASERIPQGLSAQVYRSISHSSMELVESISLNEYLPLLIENLNYAIPFRITANGTTGEVRIYDPSDPDMNRYFYFFIDSRDLPIRGNYAALRTNGLKASFALGLE